MSTHAIGGSSDHSQRSFETILKAIGVPLALAVAAAIWFANTPDSLSLQGHKALALFGGIFVLYLTEAIPLAIASLMVVPLAVLTGTANLRTALDGFSASPVYLIVGAFILATAMVKTRLAERITYIILARFGSAPTRITLGVTLVNIALAFLVPSSTARTAILLPECLSILAIFGSGARSPIACLTLALIGTISARTVFFTIPQGFLTGAAAAGGIAFINSVGAFGGFVGPYMVGFLKDATGSFDAGMICMAVILVIATGIAGVFKLVTEGN